MSVSNYFGQYCPVLFVVLAVAQSAGELPTPSSVPYLRTPDTLEMAKYRPLSKLHKAAGKCLLAIHTGFAQSINTSYVDISGALGGLQRKAFYKRNMEFVLTDCGR